MPVSSLLGDVFQVTTRDHALGQEVENMYYIQLGPGFVPSAFPSDYLLMYALMRNVREALNTRYAPIQSNEYQYGNTDVKRISGTAPHRVRIWSGEPAKFVAGWTFDLSFTFLKPGTIGAGGQNAGKMDTTFDAMSLTLVTEGTPKKNSQGFKRISGLIDTDVEDNALTGAALASWIVATTGLLADIIASGVTDGSFARWVTASAKARQAGAPVYAWDIVDIIVHRILGSQVTRKEHRRFA